MSERIPQQETVEPSGVPPDLLLEASEGIRRIVDNVERVILGKRAVIESVLGSLLVDGHVLLDDVPGVGKTMLARALARSISAEFKRIQFTPDLLPSDITGSYIFNQKTTEFSFRPGPIFANIILADEINRASPRTQSSLLEAMEERQVTVDGISHPLPRPFLVIATQNPIEHEGVYNLPEAQLDRFLIRIKIGYPPSEEEEEILEAQREVHPINHLKPVIDLNTLSKFQSVARRVYVKPSLRAYIVAICTETRNHPDVLVGASIRGSLGLMRVAQARALVNGRGFVIPEDVKESAPHVLSHRIVLIQSASLAGVKPVEIIGSILRKVPIPLQ